MYVCIYVHTYLHIYVYIRIYICIYLHTYTYMYIYAYIVNMYIYAYMYIYAHVHICMYIYIDRQTPTHTHTHTQAGAGGLAGWRSHAGGSVCTQFSKSRYLRIFYYVKSVLITFQNFCVKMCSPCYLIERVCVSVCVSLSLSVDISLSLSLSLSRSLSVDISLSLSLSLALSLALSLSQVCAPCYLKQLVPVCAKCSLPTEVHPMTIYIDAGFRIQGYLGFRNGPSPPMRMIDINVGFRGWGLGYRNASYIRKC
jgi:hypothetical protein